MADSKKKATKQPENNLILYQDENGLTRVDVRFAHEDVWLNQEQLAEIYCTTQQNISLHIRNIYADGELSQEATHKKFLLVRNNWNLTLTKPFVNCPCLVRMTTNKSATRCCTN